MFVRMEGDAAVRGPDWDEPMDEDKADRIYAAAAVVVLSILVATGIISVALIWRAGSW